ncbi:hypothetical protein HYV57_04315 [Candidatus Peregrinibacteria bacterium]|nr:hypothetical protein [Candidatus Peregrinibacteria bacterium]
MTSLTINIENELKKNAQKKAKKDGVTITFIVINALKAYKEGKLKFGMVLNDDDITASFDVSSKKGKKACLKSFETLCR